jgi:hypothetical protein
MHCFLLTDWVTLRATSAINTITQGEEGWLDLEPYQDVVAWLDVRELTVPINMGTLYLDFQTSPVKDEAYFSSLLNPNGGQALAVTNPTGSGVTVVRMTKDGTYTPLSKWLRWKLNPGTGNTASQAWDVTMRIWLAVNYGVGTGSAVRTPAAACGCRT